MPRMKNKGLFGKKPSFAMPSMQPEMPMGGGMNDLQTIMHSPQERQAAQPPMPVNDPKAGLGTRLFGQGWEDKAFALGGIMQGDPTGAYMMRQDKQAEQKARAEAAAAERKRAMDWADFQREHDYKVSNPTPSEDSFTRSMGIAGIDLNSEEGRRLARQRTESIADPIVEIPLGNGQVFVGPRSEYVAYRSGQGAPQKPQGKLTRRGGPAPSASGGF